MVDNLSRDPRVESSVVHRIAYDDNNSSHLLLRRECLVYCLIDVATTLFPAPLDKILLNLGFGGIQ